MGIGEPLRIIINREVYFTYNGWIGKGRVVQTVGSHIVVERENDSRYYVDVVYDSASLAAKSLKW